MRTNQFVVVEDTSAWTIKLLTSGNYEIMSNRLVVYRRERVIMNVTVKGNYTSKKVSISSANSAFPTAEYIVTNPTSTTANVDIDLTPYVDYLSTVVVGGSYGGTLITPKQIGGAFRLADGVNPQSIVRRRITICECTGGGGLEEDVYLYGGMPSVVDVGDRVEINAPVVCTQGASETIANYKTRFAAVQAALGAMVRTWSLKGTSGTIERAGISSTSVEMQNAGVFQLYGTKYTWAAGAASYTSYADVATGAIMRVVAADECRDAVRVQWYSRTGNLISALWDIVQDKEDIGDEVQLQTMTGEYAGYKGASRSIVLHKTVQTAFDYWYYTSIVTSNIARATINGAQVDCRVITKSAEIPAADAGETYNIEIELQYQEYDAL